MTCRKILPKTSFLVLYKYVPGIYIITEALIDLSKYTQQIVTQTKLKFIQLQNKDYRCLLKRHPIDTV